MGLLSIIGKIATVISEEITTPESFKMGEEFENYVREELFPESHYVLVERTHNYSANKKDFVEASLKPDFTFRDRKTKKEFYVEAKVRTTIFDNKIVWCNQNQLKRYNEYNKQKPVFIILDFGDKNQFISLIPLSKANYTGLFLSHAKKFEIEYNKPVSSAALWKR